MQRPPKLTLVTADELTKKEQCIKFFEPRGLDPTQYGYFYATRAEVRGILGVDPGTGAIGIPYYTEEGSPLIDEGIGDHFIRYRLTPYKSPKGKYRSVQNSYSHAYLTPGIDWAEVGANKDIPVILTEGEFKAARCCLEVGYPVCVGFSGVWNWKGSRVNLPMVAELIKWKWRDRQVYICFDSDIATKESPAQAMAQLAGTMQTNDADVWILRLDKTGRQEKGLDDYIQAGGSWDALVATAERGEPSEVAEMLAEFGSLTSQEKVINLHTGETHSPTFFHNMLAFNRRIEAVEGDKVKSMQVSKIWAGHKARIDVSKFSLNPEYGWGLQIGDGHKTWFNIWRGFKYEPKKGEHYDEITARWTEFVDGLLGKSLAALFHQWVAWIVRRPWDRNTTSWIIKSRFEGIGKSLLAETVARMLGCSTGDPARVVGPDAIFSEYPDFAEGTVLLVCNEVSSDSARHVKAMKALRTNDVLEVNKKYGAKYVVPNYLNLIITTNEDFAYGLTKDARRDIVVECELGSMGLGAWKAWVRDEIVPISTNGWGLEALMYYYQKVIDLKGYESNAEAPYTVAKEMMAEASSGGMASIQAKAEEVVGWFGGKGVVPAARLKKYLRDEGDLHAFNEGTWIKFCNLVGQIAGCRLPNRPVKVTGVLEKCLFFGGNQSEIEAFDIQTEVKRAIELLSRRLKY